VILGVTGTRSWSSREFAAGVPQMAASLKEAGVDAGRREQIVRRISDSYVSWQENSFPTDCSETSWPAASQPPGSQRTNCVVDAPAPVPFAALHLALLELASSRK